METDDSKEELLEVERYIHIDAVSLLKHFNHLDSFLFLKTQYLLGLLTRECLLLNTSKQLALPESFLRKDDLFYDDVKILVQRCFGGCNVETQPCMIPDDVQLSDLRNMARTILTMLDDLSNHGLYNLANLLTRGMVTFVKTRPQMKRVIKCSLLAIQSSQYSTDDQIKFQNGLSQLLKSPNNFRQNYRKYVKLTLESCHADIMKVLDGLKDLNFHTLTSMYRTIKGDQRYIPPLHPPLIRKPREVLIKQIRKRALFLIQQLGKSDELQKPFVKALAIPGLSLTLASCSQDLSVPIFLHVTPERKALQDEIVKAIHVLDKKIEKKEMEKLRHLLDPSSTAVGKRLKEAVKKMLIDFLYECIDMDPVPDYLLGAVSLINKWSTHNTCRSLSTDLLNEDVEFILNVSAYLKQLFWRCDPSDQLDQDFMDAYMDEAEESDDGDIADDSDNDQTMDEALVRFNDFSEEVGSSSFPDDILLITPSSTHVANFENINGFASSKLVDDGCSDTETSQREALALTVVNDCLSTPVASELVDDSDTLRKQESFNDTPDLSNTKDFSEQIVRNQTNHYVTFQEVCDNASLVAFQLIGCVLSEFGELEATGLNRNEESYLRGGDSRPEHIQDGNANSKDKDASGSVVVEAVHKVLPSFSKRELEIVKKFMES